MKENNGKLYGSTPDRLEEKLRIFRKIVEIVYSELPEEDKAYQIYKIYRSTNSAERFRSSYSVIYKLAQDDPKFKEVILGFGTIYNKLLHYDEKGYFEIAKEKYKDNAYYDNYEHAKKVITDFIQSDHSYNRIFFLKEEGIKEEDFEFCIKTIKKLDNNLFKKYEKKLEANRQQRYNISLDECKDIAEGIKTGYFLDGTPFEILEFWIRTPFKDNNCATEFNEYGKINPKIVRSLSYSGRMNNFTKYALPEEHKTIMEFIRKKHLLTATYTSELDIRYLYNGTRRFIKYGEDENGKRIITQDISITDEDLDYMIKYMRVNNLPFIFEVFKIVEKKYINGEIDIEELKKIDIQNIYSKKLVK